MSLSTNPITIAQHITALARNHHQTITLVALAGPPGCGKSTLSSQLCQHIDVPCAVVPMDGFHLNNRVLKSLGLLAKKGAPETFDLVGFTGLMQGLKAGTIDHYPTFDRHLDRVIPDGGHMPDNTQVVIVEGNYLLFNEKGWDQLAHYWDASIWMDVPKAELEARLVRRWGDQGLSAHAAFARTHGNDMVNRQRIIAHALPATWVVSSIMLH